MWRNHQMTMVMKMTMMKMMARMARMTMVMKKLMMKMTTATLMKMTTATLMKMQHHPEAQAVVAAAAAARHQLHQQQREASANMFVYTAKKIAQMDLDYRATYGTQQSAKQQQQTKRKRYVEGRQPSLLEDADLVCVCVCVCEERAKATLGLQPACLISHCIQTLNQKD